MWILRAVQKSNPTECQQGISSKLLLYLYNDWLCTSTQRVFGDEISMQFKELWVKQIALPHVVGCVQPVEGLNGTKRWTFLSRREFSSRLPSDWTCTTASLGPLAWQLTLQIGSCQSFQLCNPTLYHKSLSLYIHILLALFLWRTLTNMTSQPNPIRIRCYLIRITWLLAYP